MVRLYSVWRESAIWRHSDTPTRSTHIAFRDDWNRRLVRMSDFSGRYSCGGLKTKVMSAEVVRRFPRVRLPVCSACDSSLVSDSDVVTRGTQLIESESGRPRVRCELVSPASAAPPSEGVWVTW